MQIVLMKRLFLCSVTFHVFMSIVRLTLGGRAVLYLTRLHQQWTQKALIPLTHKHKIISLNTLSNPGARAQHAAVSSNQTTSRVTEVL